MSLSGNELPVATEDRVGSHDGGELRKGSPSNGLSPHGEASSLIIGQPESPATELLLEDSVFLPQVIDDGVLLAGDPASQSGDENLPRLEDRCHRRIVASPVGNRKLFTGDLTG